VFRKKEYQEDIILHEWWNKGYIQETSSSWSTVFLIVLFKLMGDDYD
jgi:hypothetical protein